MKTYFARVIALNKLFGGGLEMPNQANALEWIRHIYGELSPENLHCDGEISRAAAAKKARELKAALKHCEQLLGRKVDESEI